jgi:hypothetical protein
MTNTTDMTTYTPNEIAFAAVERGVRPGWHERIRDMANHGCTVTGRVNGDREVSRYTSLRVAANWPVRGSITLKREDGKTVYLRHSKSKGFTVEVK